MANQSAAFNVPSPFQGPSGRNDFVWDRAPGLSRMALVMLFSEGRDPRCGVPAPSGAERVASMSDALAVVPPLDAGGTSQRDVPTMKGR